MPRQRKFTEAAVIASAQRTFGSHGYAETSLDDLERATGLGRQSLYNAFGGKRDLFLLALSAGTSEAVAAVNAALSGPSSTPLQRIRAQMLRLAITLADPGSTDGLLTRAIVELASRDEDVATSVKRGVQELSAVYRACIIEAQEAGEVLAEVDAGSLASYFVALTRGMEVLGRAGADRAELTAIALVSLTVLPTVSTLSDV